MEVGVRLWASINAEFMPGGLGRSKNPGKKSKYNKSWKIPIFQVGMLYSRSSALRRLASLREFGNYRHPGPRCALVQLKLDQFGTKTQGKPGEPGQPRHAGRVLRGWYINKAIHGSYMAKFGPDQMLPPQIVHGCAPRPPNVPASSASINTIKTECSPWCHIWKNPHYYTTKIWPN